ncbi:MAG: hypothetical protein AAF098_16050 [Pseudomonadota bacterium]
MTSNALLFRVRYIKDDCHSDSNALGLVMASSDALVIGIKVLLFLLAHPAGRSTEETTDLNLDTAHKTNRSSLGCSGHSLSHVRRT